MTFTLRDGTELEWGEWQTFPRSLHVTRERGVRFVDLILDLNKYHRNDEWAREQGSKLREQGVDIDIKGAIATGPMALAYVASSLELSLPDELVYAGHRLAFRQPLHYGEVLVRAFQYNGEDGKGGYMFAVKGIRRDVEEELDFDWDSQGSDRVIVDGKVTVRPDPLEVLAKVTSHTIRREFSIEHGRGDIYHDILDLGHLGKAPGYIPSGYISAMFAPVLLDMSNGEGVYQSQNLTFGPAGQYGDLSAISAHMGHTKSMGETNQEIANINVTLMQGEVHIVTGKVAARRPTQ